MWTYVTGYEGTAARVDVSPPRVEDVLVVPGNVPRRPAYRLLAAVLERAIADRLALLRIDRHGDTEFSRALVLWFRSPSSKETFSFESLCAHLNLDPEPIRRRLLIASAVSLAFPPKPRTQSRAESSAGHATS